MTRILLLALLTAAWIAGEFVIDRRYRSAGGGESRDAGSLTLLHRVIGKPRAQTQMVLQCLNRQCR